MERLTYFLITRNLFDSPIWRENPHVLKLFIFLVGMARHDVKPKRFNGFEIKRGEILTSLSDISENNEYTVRGRIKKWSRQRVSRMLKKLTDHKYITLLADTYGTHIKVINYNTYQNPKTYKRTPAERVRNGCGTGADIYNKDNNGNNENKNKYSNSFLDFYKKYPIKKSKEKAFKYWQRLEQEKQLPKLQILLTAIEQQKKEKEIQINNSQFCPEWKHPATWLNQKCWEDEVNLNIKPKNKYELNFK